MADATGRALALVTTPGQSSPEAFAACIQQVVEESGDVASESAWQAFSRVIVAHWDELSQSQAPAATWSMMARATETIVKLRRGAKDQGQGSAQDALEEFRSFMADVTGKDEG